MNDLQVPSVMNPMTPKRQIFLTGAPGSGKTTLLRKVCQELESKGIPLKGFYTEELRTHGRRVGFDVVSLEGARKPLARAGIVDHTYQPKVGKYVVDVPSFESLALPALTSMQHSEGVMILDEIGKMELFSKQFEHMAQNLLQTKSIIFGTIPRLDGHSHRLVKYLHNSSAVQVITVTVDNRDTLMFEILQQLMLALSK